MKHKDLLRIINYKIDLTTILCGLTLALACGLAANLAAQENSAPEEAEEFQIIVHLKNPVASMNRREADRIFLGKAKSWAPLSFESATEPVNQISKSEVREKFTRAIHKQKKVSSIASYWQRVIFSGRGVPPAELESDEAVIKFVAARPGAIGYISSEVSIKPDRDKVKVMEIEY